MQLLFLSEQTVNKLKPVEELEVANFFAQAYVFDRDFKLV
jgi:hypothetical protein